QGDLTGRGGADPGEDAVDLVRATEDSEARGLLLGGDLDGRVLGVDRAELRGRRRHEPAVGVRQGRTATGGVDDVVEDDLVEERVGAELADDGGRVRARGVLGGLLEGDGHGGSPGGCQWAASAARPSAMLIPGLNLLGA